MNSRLPKLRTPLTPEQAVTVRAHIIANSVPEPNTGCWLWLGSWSGAKGQRARWMQFGDTLAYRLSYRAFVGELGEQLVLHSCDCGVCVNPEHLSAGTYSENLQQAWSRGRMAPELPRGERHHRSKLTNEQRLEIGRRLSNGVGYGDLVALAREFGVTKKTIHEMKRWSP